MLRLMDGADNLDRRGESNAGKLLRSQKRGQGSHTPKERTQKDLHPLPSGYTPKWR